MEYFLSAAEFSYMVPLYLLYFLYSQDLMSNHISGLSLNNKKSFVRHQHAFFLEYAFLLEIILEKMIWPAFVSQQVTSFKVWFSFTLVQIPVTIMKHLGLSLEGEIIRLLIEYQVVSDKCLKDGYCCNCFWFPVSHSLGREMLEIIKIILKFYA